MKVVKGFGKNRKVVYVSYDGTEFATAEESEKHDDEYCKMIDESMGRILDEIEILSDKMGDVSDVYAVCKKAINDGLAESRSMNRKERRRAKALARA